MKRREFIRNAGTVAVVGAVATRLSQLDMPWRKTSDPSWSSITPKPFVLVSPNGPTDGGDFGPNTVGTTTSGIQEALNSLPIGGGIVYIAPGSYTNSTQIYILGRSNVTIQGTGRSSLITMANGSNCHFLNLDSCNNIIIRDLKVDGNQQNQTGDFIGILLWDYSSDCLVENNHVSNFSHSAINTQVNATRNKFLNNHLNGNGSAFPNGWGVYCNNGVTDSLFEGNTCRGNRKWQIEVSVNCVHNMIRGNHLGDSGLKSQGGILVGYSAGMFNSVEGNDIQLTYVTQLGDAVFGIEVYTTDILTAVVGNVVTGAGSGLGDTYAGIWLDTGALRCSVVGNIVSGFKVIGLGHGRGIGFSNDPSGSSRNTVTANVVDNCDRGISIESSACLKNLLVGNILDNNTTPINDSGTGTIKANNVVD